MRDIYTYMDGTVSFCHKMTHFGICLNSNIVDEVEVVVVLVQVVVIIVVTVVVASMVE